MMKQLKIPVLVIVLLFLVACLASCSMKDLEKASNLKIGKFAQTINVDKSDLKGKIKTQWGKFSFSDKQVKKILKLKNVSKMKNSSDIKKNTYTCKKNIGDKTIMIAVTYIGEGRYQLAMGGL